MRSQNSGGPGSEAVGAGPVESDTHTHTGILLGLLEPLRLFQYVPLACHNEMLLNTPSFLIWWFI